MGVRGEAPVWRRLWGSAYGEARARATCCQGAGNAAPWCRRRWEQMTLEMTLVGGGRSAARARVCGAYERKVKLPPLGGDAAAGKHGHHDRGQR